MNSGATSHPKPGVVWSPISEKNWSFFFVRGIWAGNTMWNLAACAVYQRQRLSTVITRRSASIKAIDLVVGTNRKPMLLDISD